MRFFQSLIALALTLFSAVMMWGQVSQLAVARVDLMPNQPSPYNVRDWRQVAVRYDSFVYDRQKTGQYLPLSFLGSGGVNYPQQPTFRLHTYVGTFSPLGNEAINVLPSLVGATLVGVDKTTQFGQNWLRMSQDFFNKANGENIYLNNAGANSGGDWWYDLMPNVYFYQLYDLYPDLGGEANLQFNTIADRFLESVRAMGGQDAPWEPAYMNYRAWNFKTMQPNPNGVKEPEAAGAYAWVLYNAWKENGNPEYLKGAEWSMEFLSNWPDNPSYELQLPYGIYTAAKMNAETGTTYDIEKMINWSFNRGNLRGWGTIVGKWGGFDVSGLVGEANDAGNDYAFQLNGVQQAAALVPMVRYDKRFARAIGKWVLNLSNATRLFYPGFLPNNLQDASAWSVVNDPRQVMGYEALRQQSPNGSPFSTGDALQGGWAATNLALYGSGSIGYLGCMVDKTNVDKILRLDVLKTDFYREAAYPTFLYFNPYNIAQTVQLQLGNTPVDVYEALSESFLLQNASGTANLNIPANQAILVTLAPASGAVTYQQNRMLINGVVVDYNQHAQAYTRAPRIKALAARKNPLETGDSTTVFATVEDVDSGQITYTWSSSLGAVSGSGAQVVFKAPVFSGNAMIQLIATDPQGNSDTASLELSVVADINEAPQIVSVQKNEAFTAPGGTLQLTATATDADNDPLIFTWTANGGTFSGSGNTVNWTAPGTEGIFQLAVRATDDQGLFAEASTTILVKNFDAVPGERIAHYPFSGNALDVSGNQLHGQANGVVLVPDQNGTPQSAYYFNGGAQHILVNNSPLLNVQDAIAVSCWFSPGALPEKETFLISHGSWQNRWKISLTPDKNLRWTVNTLNTVSDLDAGVLLQTDRYYHVVATYDGALMGLYIDGELLAYKALSGKIRTTSLPFLMGQMLPDQPEYNFKGVLDAVSIFDYALAPDAVFALYQQGVTALGTPVSPETVPLVMWPNPVSGMLRIEMPSQVSAALLQVHDAAGRLVLEQAVPQAEWMEVDFTAFPPGMYVVAVLGEGGRFWGRVVKGM